jgi:mRNA interferase MazF
MTRGKIVLVPFPFDDLSAGKVRPVLCLTDPIGPYRHVVVAFISSQVPTSVYATDIVLDTLLGKGVGQITAPAVACT